MRCDVSHEIMCLISLFGIFIMIIKCKLAASPPLLLFCALLNARMGRSCSQTANTNYPGDGKIKECRQTDRQTDRRQGTGWENQLQTQNDGGCHASHLLFVRKEEKIILECILRRLQTIKNMIMTVRWMH